MDENIGQHPIKKVLIVDLSLGYGGSTSRVLTLLDQSSPGSMGLACLQGGVVTRHALERGVPVHIVGRNKMDPAILINLVRTIRKEGYELLDSQNIQSKFWANLVSLLIGTTLVSTIHSWYSNEHGRSSLKGRLYTHLELMTNQALDLYITVSNQDRQSLLSAKVPEDRIELIYNAIGIDGISIPKGNSQWLRERFNLPLRSIVCTAVGRLVPIKNHQLLVTAMGRAITQVPQLTCLIIGEGALKETLVDQIAQLGLEEHVKLTGFLERGNVLAILQASDIFVMTSTYEGTPITLLEAAALGLPIVSTRAGGIPELVNDREHALLVEPGDVQGLAQALVKLSQDREYAHGLGRHARQHVQESFSQESQIQLTWQAYRKASEIHKNKPSLLRGGG